jgi:SAM-dependent methyltransferase
VTDHVETWLAALEARQLADLTFAEVSRALRALSSTYVERRSKLKEGAALSGTGKRAAFALFYGPLHFLLVRHIVTSLGEPFTTVASIVDLGCGTGASGAGWAIACRRAPRIVGIDRHPWAIAEAKRTYADMGLQAILRVDDLTRVDLSGGARSAAHASAGRPSPARDPRVHGGATTVRRIDPSTGVLLAFAVTEISDDRQRGVLLDHLVDIGRAGGHVLVIEPLAGFVAPWWSEWRARFESAGGRSDEWRVRIALPAIVQKLDRAAGLNHSELKARSISI